MRQLVAVLFLAACGSSESRFNDAPVTSCARTVERSGPAVNDVTTLEVASDSEILVLSWRGEVDRWYPLDVDGELGGEPCSASVDRIGAGAWEIDATCSGRPVVVSVRGCAE
jgi:hypothetical protein